MNLGSFGDALFPPVCVGCGDSMAHGALCDACLASITIFNTLFCGACLARLPDGKKICHKDAPFRLGAAAAYDDPALAAAIHALKFQGIRAAAEPLAALLTRYADRVDAPFAGGYTVVPLPLSAERRRSRGFNQAALIARPFAATLGLPVEEDLLARVVHRKPQSDTEDIFERRENVRGCFAPAPGAEERISGKKIVLVDDVVTSGTTFTEAARVLRDAGAKRIFALAVAKV